ncbi:MAG: PHB depolymerase family esterase [Acetobacteraceae bacterium]
MMANLAEPGRLTLVAATGSNPGALRMLEYVPPGLPAGAPLVVVLHGCTQNAAAYDHGAGWSTLADRHGFALLFPEQERANNPNLCFNWFQSGDVTRDHGEVLSIREMVAQMIAAHGLSPERVYVTGLSAGGAMTSAMLATYPEVFAAGAIIAGLPYGAADGMQQALEAMYQVRQRDRLEWGDAVRAASPHQGPWPRVQVWQGDADATVRQGNADELLKQWADVHGLDGEPVTDRVDGALHAAWRDRSGSVVLESYLVPGLAHGTPLHTAADDMDQSMGFVAPHMLEAGISSTWRIAKSWGLLTQAAHPRRTIPHPAPAPILSRTGVMENVLRAAGLSGRL